MACNLVAQLLGLAPGRGIAVDIRRNQCGEFTQLLAILLIGQVAQDPGGRLRVRLSADYERLEFLRVLRHHGTAPITDPGSLVTPDGPVTINQRQEEAADG